MPALTVQAGTRWLEAYAAATEVGRYVQGGGAATWGVITKTTLLAHPMPELKGLLSGRIEATTAAAYRDLLVRLSQFIPRLLNPSWGEQLTFGGTYEVAISMVFVDLSVEQAQAVWAPMTEWLDDYGDEITSQLDFSVMPFADYWDASYYDETHPRYITHDSRAGAPAERFWWSGTQSEVSQYIASYQSRWLPAAMFDRPHELAALMFEAAQHNWFALHLNKGLAGASPAARARDSQTALHPAAFDAAALIITAQAVQNRYPGVAGFEPDSAALAALRQQVDDCMGVFREALPDAGSYMNEADYFEADWQRQFWGANYPRLLRIKQDVDPGNLFSVHHRVGSEGLRA